jgi:hypothetical protein
VELVEEGCRSSSVQCGTPTLLRPQLDPRRGDLDRVRTLSRRPRSRLSRRPGT